MFWRSSLRSVVVVGAIALGLALGGTGVLDRPFAQGVAGLRAWLASVGGTLLGSLDAVVSAAPEVHPAGQACALVVARGEIVGLDWDGNVASYDTACCRSDLPILTGFVPAAKKIGERVSCAEVVLGLQVLKAFEERPEVMRILSEVNLADLENPTAILCGGVRVSLGHGDYRCKLGKLDRVLACLKRINSSPKTIDLRFARQAVVTCNQPKKPSKKEV